MFGRNCINGLFAGVRFTMAMQSVQGLACKCKSVIKKDDILDVTTMSLIQEYVMPIGGYENIR